MRQVTYGPRLVKLSRYDEGAPACSVLGTYLFLSFLIKSHIKITLHPLCCRPFDCNFELLSLRL